jgi:hypothetical protein
VVGGVVGGCVCSGCYGVVGGGGSRGPEVVGVYG